MASSRRTRPVPTAGAPLPVSYTTPSKRHPLKEVGDVRTVAQEAAPPLPWDENSEAVILEHEEKVNKYQAALAAYLTAKYFSNKASDKDLEEVRGHNCNYLEAGAYWQSASSITKLLPTKLLEAKDVDHEENCFIDEVTDLDHEEKVNKYQAMLATRLKAKYFSSNAFDKGLAGDMFEEITIQSETIRMSRWPITSLFADPAKNFLEKRT